MATNLKLPKLENLEVDQHLYQSMLGSLMYTAIGMHPDIMYAVHFLSQHSITPGPEHLNAIKHMYHYLIGTLDLGLIFFRNQLKHGLVSFSNLDWAGNLNTWRSISV